MEELKNCAHCGGKPHTRKLKEGIGIGCNTKSCILYMYPSGSGTYPIDHYVFLSEEDAIKAWNTRIPSSSNGLTLDREKLITELHKHGTDEDGYLMAWKIADFIIEEFKETSGLEKLDEI